MASLFSRFTAPVAALGLALTPVVANTATPAAPTSQSASDSNRTRITAPAAQSISSSPHTRTTAIPADRLAEHFTQATDGVLAVATLQGSSKALGIPVAKYNVEFSNPTAFAMLNGNASKLGIGHVAHASTKPAHNVNVTFGNG